MIKIPNINLFLHEKLNEALEAKAIQENKAKSDIIINILDTNFLMKENKAIDIEKSIEKILRILTKNDNKEV